MDKRVKDPTGDKPAVFANLQKTKKKTPSFCPGAQRNFAKAQNTTVTSIR